MTLAEIIGISFPENVHKTIRADDLAMLWNVLKEQMEKKEGSQVFVFGLQTESNNSAEQWKGRIKSIDGFPYLSDNKISITSQRSGFFYHNALESGHQTRKYNGVSPGFHVLSDRRFLHRIYEDSVQSLYFEEDDGGKIKSFVHTLSGKNKPSFPLAITDCSALIHLRMQKMGYSQEIPEEIAKLKRLKQLNLDDNGFYGVVPESFGNLDSLNYLSLQRNQLSGVLPSELANLNELFQLRLRRNDFTGEFPAITGSSLKMIDASYNRFTGPIPQSLADCSQFIEISLNNNEFEGVIPFKMGLLPFLKKMSLAHNRLTGVVDEFGEKNIDYAGHNYRQDKMDLSHNELTGSAQELVDNYKLWVTFLDISHNNWLDGVTDIPPNIQKLKA